MDKFEQLFMTRDRVHAQGTKDLFTECARADDKAIKRRLEGGVEETLADIPNFRFILDAIPNFMFSLATICLGRILRRLFLILNSPVSAVSQSHNFT